MRIIIRGRFQKNDLKAAHQRICACRAALEAHSIYFPPFIVGTLNVKLGREFQIPDWANVIDIPVAELEKLDPGWHESWKLIPIEAINGIRTPAFILRPQKTPQDNYTVEIIAHSISLNDGAEVEIALSDTLTLKNPHDFTELIRKVTKEMLNSQEIWWRGQPDSTQELIPGVYRKNYSLNNEKTACARFMWKAPARYSDCPIHTDYAAWLMLMQHYGLRSRLLDWTESPLVALYFAVKHTPNHAPGALWVLDPFKLNRHQINQAAIMNPRCEAVRPIFKEPFAPVKEQERVEKIAAVYTPHRDLRTLVQQSVFTVHGTETSLDKLADMVEEKFLLKIEIPEEEKYNFDPYLRDLGIRPASLFPDLEYLAREVNYEAFDVTL